MKFELPEEVVEDLKAFIALKKPGSITFHSDGQVIRQAEAKTVKRYGKQ